jgi:tol-pal system protein YbgF
MLRQLAIISLVAATLSGVLPAGTKEEIIRLQSDVLQLQEQIRLLQKSMDDNNGVLKSLLEQLNDQVAKTNLVIETLAQGLQAQKADVNNSLSQLRQEVQKLNIKLDDVNNRIAGLYQKLEESQVKTASVRAIPEDSSGVSVQPDQLYSQVYNDYLMGNYDLAIAGFQDFLRNYPNSEYADNALYYLGVCYLEQSRFEPAVQSFDQVINLYPKGDKTPVAYFKKAVAYQQLQRIDDVVEALRKLIELFPDAPEAKLAEQELDKLGVPKTAPKPLEPERTTRRRRS